MSELTITQTELNFTQIQSEYATKSPQQILQFALSKFENIAISFSGAEDVILIDMAAKISKNLKVFSIDTGRLHPETYKLFEQVRKRYDIELDIIFPDAQQIENLVRNKGLFSFYQDGHKECCGIRKVRPLRRKLSTLDAWVTGQRKDQSPNTRANIPVIQLDMAFSTEEHKIIKFNPLANWSSDQVWEYIRYFDVPYNQLHEKGFISIGCEPCTKTVLPNQHEREGRWWWETAQKKECGFHAMNVRDLANK
ncbi:MAG: phosphoadenylyl-sulfate reductase [Cyanobacteria bacterium P01_F01_bin.143]